MTADDITVRITGVGSDLPPDVVTTAEVEERAGLARFGLEPGWLEQLAGAQRVYAVDWRTTGLAPSCATTYLDSASHAAMRPWHDGS